MTGYNRIIKPSELEILRELVLETTYDDLQEALENAETIIEEKVYLNELSARMRYHELFGYSLDRGSKGFKNKI